MSGRPKSPTGEEIDLVKTWLLDRGRRGITRGELSEFTGIPDRVLRECIQTLALEGFPVVSTSGEAGYRITDDPEELRSAAKELRHRIALESQRAQALEDAARRLELASGDPQPAIPGVRA